ncbi:DUF1801 domain-containing protein [Flavobacterium sp.]|uniref:DUF1801 domain-containing protein n=1 Tax=Flavobacterium sp. TaxID=239 RepID=UPI0034501DEE
MEIDHYINSFPEKTQTLLKQLRNSIQEILPKAEEAISYGIPIFLIDQNHCKLK